MVPSTMVPVERKVSKSLPVPVSQWDLALHCDCWACDFPTIRRYCATMADHRSLRTVQSCAASNTVVGTVVSASYILGLEALSMSAVASGFSCIAVQPFDWFKKLRNQRYAVLKVAQPPLLPSHLWCSTKKVLYGWRRSQLYRTRLWRTVVELGLDLLAMDLDHQLPSWNLVGFLRALQAPAEAPKHRALTTSNASRAAPADVVAVWDGRVARYLNVGIMWLRSTPGTIKLTRRSENRSWVGWEQQVFNEELNFNQELVGIRCCHTKCLKHLTRKSNSTASLPQKTARQSLIRRFIEGRVRCSSAPKHAARPPVGSPEPWVRAWTPNADVPSSRHTTSRKYGRCNHPDNVCVSERLERLDCSEANDALIGARGRLCSNRCPA